MLYRKLANARTMNATDLRIRKIKKILNSMEFAISLHKQTFKMDCFMKFNV